MSDSKSYNDIYKEISELLGEDAVKKIWKRFRGLNVSFPQRLYSKQYTRDYIKANRGSVHPREMAETLNLTERRVRQILKEIREEEQQG